jgi:hypothetical protein
VEKARRSVPRERAPFALALTAGEVEEDVYALTGARPRRRPRKRPRVVQRQLDVRPISETTPRAPPIYIITSYNIARERKKIATYFVARYAF